MSASASIGKGTTLGTSPDNTTYTPIAELQDCNFPEVDCDDVEVTDYGSSQVVFIPGWDAGQDMSFATFYTKVVYAALIALRRTTKYYKITLPDTSSVMWQGYMKKVGGPIPLKGAIINNSTVKVNSAITFTAAA